MPWCDECAKFWSPSSMLPNGACPTCQRVLATKGALRMEARMLGEAAPGQSGDAEAAPKAPWHFKLMLVCLAVYLGWRLVQGIVWVAGRL